MVSKIQKIYVKELPVSYEQLMSAWMAPRLREPWAQWADSWVVSFLMKKMKIKYKLIRRNK
jgi:hypothetical protein